MFAKFAILLRWPLLLVVLFDFVLLLIEGIVFEQLLLLAQSLSNPMLNQLLLLPHLVLFLVAFKHSLFEHLLLGLGQLSILQPSGLPISSFSFSVTPLHSTSAHDLVFVNLKPGKVHFIVPFKLNLSYFFLDLFIHYSIMQWQGLFELVSSWNWNSK